MARFLQNIAIVALLCFNNANAEQSGGFLGLEAGYGTLNVPFDYSITTQKFSGNFSGGGVAFGFVGGYKQFFNPYFGLRYYANINVLMARLNSKVTQNQANLILDAGDNRSATLINYGADIDMLINFIVRERNRIADFGMFVGLGIGGNNWSGAAIDDIDNYVTKREQDLKAMLNGEGLGWKASRNFFDLSLNVGLRTNIATNHGLEFAFRMPLLNDEFLKKEKSINNMGAVKLDVHRKTLYNIALRYTYSFGSAKKVVRKIKKQKRPANQRPKQQMKQQDMLDL